MQHLEGDATWPPICVVYNAASAVTELGEDPKLTKHRGLRGGIHGR